MKYIKKPIVVEAIKWTGENISEVCKFMSEDVSHVMVNGNISILTLEGILTVSKGDMIIKGIRGEFYPCKPDIFKQTYDGVQND